MRKLAFFLLGLGALSTLAFGAGFLGGEIIPFHSGATYGKPFLTFGAYWPQDDWGPVLSVGSDSPVVPDGWYFVALAGRKNLTSDIYSFIGGSYFLEARRFTLTRNSTWTVFAGIGLTIVKHLDGFVRFNVPLKANPGAPLFGAWISVGLDYYFEFPIQTGGTQGETGS